MPEAYPFRPDVYIAVVQAVPLICKSKRDVVTFFRGTGMRHKHLDVLAKQVASDPDSLKKHHMTDELLEIANRDASDAGLKVRREILKRIVDFNNFESCWPNDQLAAKGAVAKVRELIQEKDAFTRMAQAHDRERAQMLEASRRQAAEKRRQQEERERVKQALYAVIVMPAGKERGDAFERVLNQIFALDGLLVREAFTLSGDEGVGIVEQIDGVVELDYNLYLVEAKFYSANLGVGEVAQHMVRVSRRSGVRGMFVVHPGFSAAAIDSVKAELHRSVFVLATVEELVCVFESDVPFTDWLRNKARHAAIDRDPHRLYAGREGGR